MANLVSARCIVHATRNAQPTVIACIIDRKDGWIFVNRDPANVGLELAFIDSYARRRVPDSARLCIAFGQVFVTLEDTAFHMVRKQTDLTTTVYMAMDGNPPPVRTWWLPPSQFRVTLNDGLEAQNFDIDPDHEDFPEEVSLRALAIIEGWILQAGDVIRIEGVPHG